MLMQELWKLGIMILIALIVAYGGIITSIFLGPRKPTKTKNYPYESGIQIKEGGHGRMSVKYFLVALLFLVFDVDAVILIPWALQVGDMKLLAAVEGGLFILVLLVAYLYALGKDAVRWID